MKKLILAITLLVAFTMNAQGNGKGKKAFLKNLSNEQAATLKTKKMTLQLDLSERQIDPIYTINLDLITKRRAKVKMTKEEREKMSTDEKYNKLTERLDQKIATKKRFKEILSDNQMEKLVKVTAQKHRKHKRHRQSK